MSPVVAEAVTIGISVGGTAVGVLLVEKLPVLGAIWAKDRADKRAKKAAAEAKP